MRTRLYSLLLLMLLLGGCHSEIDSDLALIERRIARLEQRCDELNSTLKGIQTMLDNLTQYDFITSIEPFYNAYGTAGYTISFTHSDPITLYNGIDAETPELGVAKGDDGIWYWTVRYPSDTHATFITDNYGMRIATSAASPILKIEDDNWMVTYDGGELWITLGRATGQDGASFFESVQEKNGIIEFKMLNGTVLEIPTWASFEALQEKCRKVNENVESFTQLAGQFHENVYVQDIIPILDGVDTIGCRLRLSDGSAYPFYNGTGTNIPVIGAQQDSTDSANVWYWTIQYGTDPAQWILDENGQKIQANAPQGQTPKISLQQVSGDPAWYWAVAYGSGKPTFLLHDGNKVAASVTAPDAVVQSIVQVNDDMVRISIAGGLSCDIPLATAIIVTLQAPVENNTLSIDSGETISFRCSIQGADERADVLPLTDDRFYATATAENAQHSLWTITVLAPSPFTAPSSSRLNLLVSNGKGQMKTVIVNIIPKN